VPNPNTSFLIAFNRSNDSSNPISNKKNTIPSSPLSDDDSNNNNDDDDDDDESNHDDDEMTMMIIIVIIVLKSIEMKLLKSD
jgi:hypothetical protein